MPEVFSVWVLRDLDEASQLVQAISYTSHILTCSYGISHRLSQSFKEVKSAATSSPEWGPVESAKDCRARRAPCLTAGIHALAQRQTFASVVLQRVVNEGFLSFPRFLAGAGWCVGGRAASQLASRGGLLGERRKKVLL